MPVIDTPPRRRWCHARTWLDDFAIVTWAVGPSAVARLLPHGWVPDVRSVDGQAVTLVSMVAFQDRDFHFNFCPSVRLRCGQINYRTYVRDPDGRSGVWFFGTSLASGLVGVARLLWQMPWHRADIDVRATWHGDALRNYQLRVSGDWDQAHLSLSPNGGTVAEPAALGFADANEASRILFDPYLGWYRRRDGGVGHYSVWHAPLNLTPVNVVDARAPVLERLGLVHEDQSPIDARVVRATHFDVHTPARRIRS